MNKLLANLLPSKTKKGGSVDTKTSGTTAIWIGATVVFAMLFFLSSVLDMKVKVTFGQDSGTTSTRTTTTTTPNTSGGIASQVGGC
ncbi:MAG TPA: hypothetical protein VFK94_07215 [Patescibacteria group bacterium]|nr:hypothetical protein [Patescibacteria group bacterium]